jgi:large subunit ribosomal protein L13
MHPRARRALIRAQKKEQATRAKEEEGTKNVEITA